MTPMAERGQGAIENRQRSVRVELRPLQSFLLTVKRELGLRGECVAVCLIEDREMARLNQIYRKKRGPTDVLSFPVINRRKSVALAKLKRHTTNGFLGDIAISPVVAKRNAAELGRKLREELQILILHGMLHLLGYDHETDRGEMERIELRLRRRLGLT
jgi:probable rRNA maturation factor